MRMTLTADEQAWLDAYRQVLKEQYPCIVERMVIYGSPDAADAQRPEAFHPQCS